MPAITKHDEGMKESKVNTYEIGYVLVSSIPSEKVAENVSALKDALAKKSASIIEEGNPELRKLAYTMVKKVGANNLRFTEGYFGWVKFNLAGSEIEGIKNVFESHPNMLRTLIISTVPTTTYLGKISPAMPQAEEMGAGATSAATPAGMAYPEAVTSAPVASVEAIDKSIDEMVK